MSDGAEREWLVYLMGPRGDDQGGGEKRVRSGGW
jgi:hypothetical protein